ncbi:MAG TPA: hypothetical protein VFR02_05410, partial [bacterium]|nr:hypothetical protein [bacterium]
MKFGKLSTFFPALALFGLGLAPNLSAQCLVSDPFNGSLLSAWTTLGIGGATGTTAVGAALTITSQDTGVAISGTTDSFTYLAQSVAGDPEITLEIDSMPASVGGRAGLMLRASGTGNGNIYFFVGVNTTAGGASPSGNYFIQDRATTGGTSTALTTGGTWTSAAPAYVRVTKIGTGFNGFYSSDGSSWTRIGGFTNIGGFPGGAYNAGIAMSSTVNAPPGGSVAARNFNVLAGFCTPTSTPTATPTPTVTLTPTITLTSTKTP